MARIDVLPSIEIIRGFKGILDFYLWKGLPCVRAWPRWRPARQSNASRNAALLFGAVIKAFSLTHNAVLQQLELEATGIPRTPRDIYVSGIYGNLHEASMSDFLDLLTQCRDFLSDLTALLNALDTIDTDELVVNVDESVLPPLAATTTNQATQITALQKIDDLQDALKSKGLDHLLVRGANQLFSFAGPLGFRSTGAVSGPGGHKHSAVVPAGQIWIVTTAAAVDATTATTNIIIAQVHNAADAVLQEERRAFAAGEWSAWSGFTTLDPGDFIRAYFTGALGGDSCTVDITGYIMTHDP